MREEESELYLNLSAFLDIIFIIISSPCMIYFIKKYAMKKSEKSLGLYILMLNAVVDLVYCIFSWFFESYGFYKLTFK
jgi:hypothetical protein